MSSATFDWTVRVYYEDTDAAGIVYYANYLRFIERARTEWLRALGWDQHVLMKEGLAFVVAEVKAKYLRPGRLDDLLTVHCEVTELKRASLEFSQEVRRGDETIFKGTVRVGCINLNTMRPSSLPDRLVEQLNGTVLKV